jgi:hypothetical protein
MMGHTRLQSSLMDTDEYGSDLVATISDEEDRAAPGRPARQLRRLSDKVVVAFHFACDQGELEVAWRLLQILETVIRRPPPNGQPERRNQMPILVAAHERLWHLRHRQDLME